MQRSFSYSAHLLCRVAPATIGAVLFGMAASTAASTRVIGTPETYLVTFRLTAASSNVVAGLQWRTNYSAATGVFRGSDAMVSCTSPTNGLFAPQDVDATKMLTLAVLTYNGFAPPTEIATCVFDGYTNDPPLAGDFLVTIEDQTDEDGNPVTTTIGVTVSAGVSLCGNAVVNAGEQCDDGNSLNSDACTNTCRTAKCGDGYVRAGVEQCDDGNSVNTDACAGTCKTAKCGDAFVRADVEQCDDGNTVNTDACPGTCKTAVCGDGYSRSGVEECDDANSVDGDGCSNFCETQQLCGDATDDGTLFASDALRILQRAVGMDVECPQWICDVDGSNGIAASDALRLLRKSVDLPVTLTCGEPTAIFIRITTSTTLGSLQINVGYQDVAGEISGSGGTVACEAVQPDVQSAFNDKPDRILSASFASLSGIHGPAALARCGFTADAEVAPEDFTVTVLEAKDKAGNTVPKPGVKVVPD